jgi:hypothetical protein
MKLFVFVFVFVSQKASFTPHFVTSLSQSRYDQVRESGEPTPFCGVGITVFDVQGRTNQHVRVVV